MCKNIKTVIPRVLWHPWESPLKKEIATPAHALVRNDRQVKNINRYKTAANTK